MIVQSKLTNEELLKYIYKAAAEYDVLIEKSFLIIGKNKNSKYYWFECQFEKKNFMHLLGIDSVNYNAEDFFDKCNEYDKGIGSGILIKDCTHSRNHNRTTINEKASVCAEILKIHNAKCFKIGDKDKISRYVDFSYAYGSEVTMGFQKNNVGSSFPITLIPKNIDTFATKKYKVVFVYKKYIDDKVYKELFFEIKKELIKELFADFPEKLKKRIHL